MALLCSMKSASDIFKYILAVLGMTDPETAKQLADLIKKLGNPPKSGPEECCTKANGSKAALSGVRSLEGLIGAFCKTVGRITYAPGTCVKKTTDGESCANCCSITFPGEGDPGNNRTRCEYLCAKGFPGE